MTVYISNILLCSTSSMWWAIEIRFDELDRLKSGVIIKEWLKQW